MADRFFRVKSRATRWTMDLSKLRAEYHGPDTNIVACPDCDMNIIVQPHEKEKQCVKCGLKMEEFHLTTGSD